MGADLLNRIEEGLEVEVQDKGVDLAQEALAASRIVLVPEAGNLPTDFADSGSNHWPCSYPLF